MSPDFARTRPLNNAFFDRPAPQVARDLLGQVLVHSLPGAAPDVRAGRIVETEAYGEEDPASHSCRGITPRTEVMFGPGGHAYVYRSYGIHWCINVTCGPRGVGAAVLLRAVEPLMGEAAMAQARARHRKTSASALSRESLCRGPGNLTQAFGIHAEHNACTMMQGALRIVPAAPLSACDIACGPRIGIRLAKEVPWRFFMRHCVFVSGPRTPKPARI